MDICKSLSDVRGWDVEIASESVFPLADGLAEDASMENELVYAGRLEISQVDSTNAISFAFDGELVR